MTSEDLIAFRRELERAWSDDTVHPGYACEDRTSHPSRGQCGVSSAYLLKVLRAHGVIQALYCFGDVILGGGKERTIEHHCWVECGHPDDRNRYVLDLTSDQLPDVGAAVICDEFGRLANSGITYLAKVRLLPDEIPGDRVWPRVVKLEEQMARLSAEQVAASRLPRAAPRRCR